MKSFASLVHLGGAPQPGINYYLLSKTTKTVPESFIHPGAFGNILASLWESTGSKTPEAVSEFQK